MAEIAMVVKLTAVEGKVDELLEAAAKLVAGTEGEDGTLQYVVHTDAADPNAIWFYERYADQAALDAHAGSTAMAEAMGCVRRAARRPARDARAVDRPGARAPPAESDAAGPDGDLPRPHPRRPPGGGPGRRPGRWRPWSPRPAAQPPAAGVRRRPAGGRGRRRDRRGQAALAVEGRPGGRPRPGRRWRGPTSGAARRACRCSPTSSSSAARPTTCGRRGPPPTCRCCARTSRWRRPTCATPGSWAPTRCC